MVKKIIAMLFLLSSLLSSCATAEEQMWEKYFKDKLGREPRQLFVKSLKSLPHGGHVLSLGTGVGNEEMLLLKKGWSLDCIEKEKSAIKIMMDRPESIQNKERIRVINKSFEEVSSLDLASRYDFIYAGFSLPFATEKYFFNVWSLVISKLRKDGIFAGQFFGNQHKKLNVEVIYLNKNQMENLFKDFKIISLEETNEHVIEVIAKKKS